MYGLDGIPGWERLQLVVSNENKERINAKKSQVDFWLNLWILDLLLLIGLSLLAWRGIVSWWSPVAAIAGGPLCLRRIVGRPRPPLTPRRQRGLQQFPAPIDGVVAR